jgi:glycerol-3-phosphate acyltransferase PlsY
MDLGPIYSPGVMMLYAAALLIGHCLPLSNKLRGGRGIFTYIGIMAYFNILPTLITVFIAWLLVIVWKQIRFAQYMIVILPLFVTILFDSFIKIYSKVLPHYYIPMSIGMMALMGILNFFVSKKLGEF